MGTTWARPRRFFVARTKNGCIFYIRIRDVPHVVGHAVAGSTCNSSPHWTPNFGADAIGRIGKGRLKHQIDFKIDKLNFDKQAVVVVAIGAGITLRDIVDKRRRTIDDFRIERKFALGLRGQKQVRRTGLVGLQVALEIHHRRANVVDVRDGIGRRRGGIRAPDRLRRHRKTVEIRQRAAIKALVALAGIDDVQIKANFRTKHNQVGHTKGRDDGAHVRLPAAFDAVAVGVRRRGIDHLAKVDWRRECRVIAIDITEGMRVVVEWRI